MSLTCLSVRVCILNGLWSPNEIHVSVIDQPNDHDNEQHKHVANNFGWAHGKSSRHFLKSNKLSLFKYSNNEIIQKPFLRHNNPRFKST